MTKSQEIAAVALLNEACVLVRAYGFQHKVPNGMHCPSCQAHGQGSMAEHEPDCPAKRWFKDVNAFLGELGRQG